MSKLFIIGNGFDLHHDLPTRYADFAEYLKKNNKSMYYLIIKYYGHQFEKKVPYEDVEEYSDIEDWNEFDNKAPEPILHEPDLWQNFEEALGNLNTTIFTNKLEETYYQNHVMEKEGLYEQTPYNLNFDDDDESVVEAIHLITKNILAEFIEWISSMDINNSTEKINILSEFFLYINFNYTPTLERIYSIPMDNITYLHGKTENNDSIVLGHNTTYTPKVKRLSQEEVMNGETEPIDDPTLNNLISTYYDITKKPVEKIINNTEIFRLLEDNKLIEEIYILGHSLGDVDLPYFKRINDILPNKNISWYISYHTDEEKNTLYWIAENDIGVPEYLINMIQISDI